ncbi:MAG: hypothetical protein GY946_31205 [bacterium]|nr:hypothetical protein [bacterium]
MAYIRDLLLHTSPWVLPLMLLLMVAAGTWMGLRLTRGVTNRRVARSRSLGRVGRDRALRLLRRGGYSVLEEEVTGEGTVLIDGVPEDFLVRADALVRRKRQVFVAEFKNGPEASRVSTRATRRQLLEYAWVFDVDGVLLVDAESGAIQHVVFEGLA